MLLKSQQTLSDGACAHSKSGPYKPRPSRGRKLTFDPKRAKRTEAMPLKLEFELEQPPEDGISCVEFCPSPASPFLLCSSWDCGLRLYNVQHNHLKAKIVHPVRLASER